MWRECAVGDFTTVERTLRQEKVRSSMIGKSIGLEGGDVVMSDDEVETEDVSGMNLAAISEEGGPDEDMSMDIPKPTNSRQPVIDDEGFQTVNRKSTRTNKPK